MPESHATFTKRVERVLIEIAESSESSTEDKLAAISQLIRIKQVKAKRKPNAKSKRIKEGMGSVLGSK